MVVFTVADMYSTRSAAAIGRAVKALDGRAVVRVDMERRRVEIEDCWAPIHELRQAIGRAGFTPVPVLQPPLHIGPERTLDLPLP